jgi:hypothetical protein
LLKCKLSVAAQQMICFGSQLTHLIANTAIKLEWTRSRLKLYPDDEERNLLVTFERYLINVLASLHKLQEHAEAIDKLERNDNHDIIEP